MLKDLRIGNSVMARSPATELIEQAAILLAMNPALAEELALSVMETMPDDPRARLIIGSARRRQGNPVDALQILAPLANSFPKATKTHFELGVTLSDLGKTSDAIVALRHALTLDPEFCEAWRVLGDQLFLDGDTAGGEAAFAEHVRTSVQSPQLKRAAEAFAHRKFEEAEELLRTYLTGRPDDAEAMHLMGETLLRIGRYVDAETILACCLDLDPNQDGARFCYAEALFHQQKGSEASEQAQRLLVKKPKDPAYLNLFAACLGLIGEDDRVGEIYQQLLLDYPKQARIWLNYGHALRTIGKRDGAVAAYRRCIAMAPRLGEAYWSLANLKVEDFTPKEVASMLALTENADLEANDRLQLHYALGKAFEDRGDYAASFEQYDQAAKIRRALTPYDHDETSALTQRTEIIFTKRFFADRHGLGYPSKAPIFIVGLPRSGSTLVEQILASHSEVEGTRELPDIGFIARELGWMKKESKAPYPYRVATLNRVDLSSLGS